MQKFKKIIKEIFSKKRTIENINNISYSKMREMLKEKTDILVLDVRSPQEYKEGHITGAINIPEYEILTKANDRLQSKDLRIIVYCSSGSRSKKAVKELKKLGFTNIYNLEKGIEEKN